MSSLNPPLSIARRSLLVLGLAAPFGALAGYPDKLIRLVNPYPAGGTSDTIARILAHRLAEEWGQPVVVENRAGANGSVGAAHVAASAPDGHTLLLATPAFSAYNAFNRDSGFDPLKDFTPISLVGDTPAVLVVPANAPYRSVQEFVAAARASKAPFAYGTSGHGSSNHIQADSLTQLARFAATHVPYRGDVQVTTDLVGGRLQFAVLNAPGVAQLLRAGRLKALGTLTARRTELLPDVPTLTESGVPLVAGSRFFLVAPAGTPAAVVQRIHQTVDAVLTSAPIRQRLQELGADAQPSSPEQAARLIRQEVQRAQEIAARLVNPNSAGATS